MTKKFGVPVRVDEELEQILRDLARKNQISMRQASRHLARMSKSKLKGNKSVITDEIRF